jgi:DNA-binding Lrp family transcriptional regulator
MGESTNEVHAAIELKITPQRDSGFGKIAERVSRFEQVEACFLMSGGYDLLVFVKGGSLQDVAQFVAQDISTIDGVLSTATHFMLKTYKASGSVAPGPDGRLAVTP